MTVLVVQFEGDAPPGQIGEALAAAGLALEVRHPYARDALPPDAAGLTALAVLGGAMDATEPALPYLRDVQALIADAARRDVPVLGLCLGGQLCSLALGGTVGRRPGGIRIGWLPVEPVGRDPLTAGMSPATRLFRWHQDCFTLPPGATPLLAGADGFRLGSVCALQPHPEVDRAIVAGWCATYGSDAQLAAAGTSEAEAIAGAGRYAAAGRALLDAWCAEVAAGAARAA